MAIIATSKGQAVQRKTIVTDSEHKLFRKPVRITSTRDGVELRRHDTIQFVVEKSGNRNIATDTIKI